MSTMMGWTTWEKGKTYEQRIIEAAEYFQKKHGKRANYCQVNKELANIAVPDIQIEVKQFVFTPNMFYIGVK